MQHPEVLPLVGQGLFHFRIVLFKGCVPAPSVGQNLCIPLDVYVEYRPERFGAVILYDLGVAPAGPAAPVLEGDHNAHLFIALAPPGLSRLWRAYLELVNVDLPLQGVPFTALHGHLHLLPEEPGRLLVDPEVLGEPDAVGPLLAGGYLVEHLKGLVDAELQFVEQCARGGGLVVAALAAPAAGGLLALYVGSSLAPLAGIAVRPLELGQKIVTVLFCREPFLEHLSIKFFQYFHLFRI